MGVPSYTPLYQLHPKQGVDKQELCLEFGMRPWIRPWLVMRPQFGMRP